MCCTLYGYQWEQWRGNCGLETIDRQPGYLGCIQNLHTASLERVQPASLCTQCSGTGQTEKKQKLGFSKFIMFFFAQEELYISLPVTKLNIFNLEHAHPPPIDKTG
jgi:hypothetical protein